MVEEIANSDTDKQVNMLNKAHEMADFVIMNQSATITSQKYISGINCSLLW